MIAIIFEKSTKPGTQLFVSMFKTQNEADEFVDEIKKLTFGDERVFKIFMSDKLAEIK